MSDRDGPRSNPYHLDPRVACEACVFGSGEHAAWCPARDTSLCRICGVGIGQWHDLSAHHTYWDSPFTHAEWMAGGSTWRERYATQRNKLDARLSHTPPSGDKQTEQ